jgi:hypothetical protein
MSNAKLLRYSKLVASKSKKKLELFVRVKYCPVITSLVIRVADYKSIPESNIVFMLFSI